MGKFILSIFVLFLIGVVASFAVINNDSITLKVPFDKTYEVPKIALILFSGIFGAISMLIVYVIRDTRRFIENYQSQKRLKKEVMVQELYSKSLNAILANDDEEAKKALEDILREDSGHTNAYLRLGDISFREGSFQAAVSYYKEALSVSPKNFESLFSLEKAMEAMGRWTDALAYIDEILDIDADNLSALYKKRNILERTGRWEEVIDVQKSILKHEHTEKERQREQGSLIGYRYEHARASLEAGEKEKANKEFRTILRMEKGFTPAYLGVAEVMLEEGESEDAVNFLEKGYEQTQSHIILARLEDMLINLGDPYRIIRIYKNAIAQNPYDSTLRFFMGKLFYRLEMVDDAFDALKEVDISEHFPELHQLLGELHMRRYHCEKAVEEFKKTIEMKKTMRLPYCCNTCGHSSEEWSGRCPVCEKWNSYYFNLHGTCKV